MEHTLRQLQFNFGFLATLRTGLAGIVWRHLMEVFTITFCDPVAPLKEHTPRRVRDGLGKVSVLYHVAWLEFLCNNSINPFVMEKGVSRFRDKVKTLAGDNIRLFCQCVFRLIPSLALILLARQVAVKFHEFAFSLSGKSEGWVSSHLQKSSESLVCLHPHHKRISGHISAYQALRKR